jgi:transketolase
MINLYDNPFLDPVLLNELHEKWKRCARRIIISTTLSKSGHPGGSLSSLHTLLSLYSVMKHNPQEIQMSDRDRFISSIGHISPAVYSVLTEFGYFSEKDFFLGFRKAGHVFGGHVEIEVPGVEWNTGNLGQGLSVGAGVALALKLKEQGSRVFVHMGDGEQQKGQIAEARRFASKYRLTKLFGIIDRNFLQIGGNTEEVMPTNIREEYLASGWNVRYVPFGHDFSQILSAFKDIFSSLDETFSRPTVIIMRTVMGYGISFMENKAKYHGSVLSVDDAKLALKELGFEPDELDHWIEQRNEENLIPKKYIHFVNLYPEINTGSPRLYSIDKKSDCRSAYGEALKDLAVLNNKIDSPKITGFSCDLETSVKMQGFRLICPYCFFESGIQEHHAATAAGAISREQLVTFFSTFGVFAVNETANQHRLNDQNQTNLKIVSTHLGLDVGEDGPTHQAIDYIGIMQNIPGFSIIMPADANQTDRVIRYVASKKGNFFVGMGRSILPIITKEDGVNPYYDLEYSFEPGNLDFIRTGGVAVIITYGTILANVMRAYALLLNEGIKVSVVNAASINPIDRNTIIDIASKYPMLTVEDHFVKTGIGSIIKSIIAEEMIPQKIKSLGVTRYGGSGNPQDLYAAQGMDPDSIVKEIKILLSA